MTNKAWQDAVGAEEKTEKEGTKLAYKSLPVQQKSDSLLCLRVLFHLALLSSLLYQPHYFRNYHLGGRSEFICFLALLFSGKSAALII